MWILLEPQNNKNSMLTFKITYPVYFPQSSRFYYLSSIFTLIPYPSSPLFAGPVRDLQIFIVRSFYPVVSL